MQSTNEGALALRGIDVCGGAIRRQTKVCASRLSAFRIPFFLALVLAFGPICIACAAFEPTARFFAAGRSETAALGTGGRLSGRALTASSADLAPFQVTTAAREVNAPALLQCRLCSTQALRQRCTGACRVSGLLLAAIGWQLPSVASGIAGGAMMSGVGCFCRGLCFPQRSQGARTPVGAGRGPGSAWQ